MGGRFFFSRLKKMTAAGTRSRSTKRVSLPAETKDASETSDAISIQLKKLLEATEAAASVRTEKICAQMDRRCEAMESLHTKAQQALQIEVEKLQKEVKKMSEQHIGTENGESDSAQMQKMEDKIARLSETESKGRAAHEERAFRLQASVAGLVTRMATVEQVTTRLDALERRVARIERGMQANELRKSKEPSKHAENATAKVQALARAKEPIKGILKGWGSLRSESMVNHLSDACSSITSTTAF